MKSNRFKEQSRMSHNEEERQQKNAAPRNHIPQEKTVQTADLLPPNNTEAEAAHDAYGQKKNNNRKRRSNKSMDA